MNEGGRSRPSFAGEGRAAAALFHSNRLRAKLKVSILLFYIISIITIFSCGLPKEIFLSAPGFSKSGESLFILTHTTDNYDPLEGSSQSFKGYEIFYRIFGLESAAQAAISQFQAKQSQYETNPSLFISYATDTADFSRLRSSGASKPLLAIPSPSADSKYEIRLSAAGSIGEWELAAYGSDSGAVWLYRSIDDSARWSFCNRDNLRAGDADYSGADSPDRVFLVLFAVAYGIDPESIGQAVYSLPELITASGNLVSYDYP